MSIKDPILRDPETGERIAGLTQEQHDRAYDYHVTFRVEEHGKRVFEQLNKRFFEPLSFDLNPHATAFNEGSRAVVAYIRHQHRMWDNLGHLPTVEETDEHGGRTEDSTGRSDGHYL